MKVKTINIEKFLSVIDIEEYRKFFEMATARERSQLLTYITLDIFNSLNCRRYSLGKQKNLYCNIYTALVEFFALNLLSIVY